MFLIDLERGAIVDDEELKRGLAEARPYRRWLNETQIKLENLPPEVAAMAPAPDVLLDRQQAFGYSQEDLKFFLGPMATGRAGPCRLDGPGYPYCGRCRTRPKLLYDYFTQCFAQVTNPPIDPIRERAGDVAGLADRPAAQPPRSNDRRLAPAPRGAPADPQQRTDLEKIRHIHEKVDNAFRTHHLDICFVSRSRRPGMAGPKTRSSGVVPRRQADGTEGFNIIILSDRAHRCRPCRDPRLLLATSAVHHHLIRSGPTHRGRPCGGDRRGASGPSTSAAARRIRGFEAINPYLAIRDDLRAAPPSD